MPATILESRQSEVTIGMDTKLLDKEAVDAAFSLKKGKMSNVIGGKNGYYIIYCENDNDEDATYAMKMRLLLKNARLRCLKKSILSGSQSQASI